MMGLTLPGSTRPRTERSSPATGASGRFQRWLFWNLPPMSGRLRFVFYGGSLALFAFLNGGLDFTLAAASPHLYEPKGLTGLLGIPYLAPSATRVLMGGLYLAWLCAAVGLFTRQAKIATAVGMFVAVGLEQAYETGATHTHYLLLYALVCLCFTTSDLDWSVDAWLRRSRERCGEHVRERPGLGATGLPRNVFLIVVVAFYWCSGVSKLIDGGLVWADGSSLQSYIGSQVDRTSFETITSLRIWAAGQLWLCRLLSIATLALELMSPLALLWRPLRHLFIPSWVAMHMGILLLMAPNFWIHSWCVAALATDWEWLRRVMRGESPIAEAPALRPATATLAYSFRASVVSALLLPLPFLPALLQLEWFPVTHVGMYGSYLAPGVIAGIPEVDFGVETRVREIARSCAGSRTFGYTRRCSWRIPRYLVDRTSLELRGPGQPPAPFPGRIDGLRYAVIAQLASGAPASSESDPGAELARRVHALLASAPPGALTGYDSFTLSYRLNDGVLPLLSGPIGDSPSSSVP